MSKVFAIRAKNVKMKLLKGHILFFIKTELSLDIFKNLFNNILIRQYFHKA